MIILGFIYQSAVQMYYIQIFIVIYSSLHGFIKNQNNDQLPISLLAELVDHYTGIRGVMGSNPVQAWIFFHALFSLFLKWCLLLRRSLSFSFINSQFKYMIFIYSQSFTKGTVNPLQYSYERSASCSSSCEFQSYNGTFVKHWFLPSFAVF